MSTTHSTAQMAQGDTVSSLQSKDNNTQAAKDADLTEKGISPNRHDVETPDLNDTSQPDSTAGSGGGADNDRKAFQARFEPGDPENPHNFSSAKKVSILVQMSLLALVGSLGTSIIAPAEPVIARYTNTSTEVATLVLSLYVLGFAVGPLLWAPVSEVFGRRWSMLPPVFGLALFSVGTATSTNAASIFVTRFLAAVFGSAPQSNVSAAMGDFYGPKTRGVAMTFFAVCVVGGPTLAPLIGSALLVNPKLGWRWTEYMQAIISFAVVVICIFFLPETYGPVLLRRKAARLRKETGDDRWWHPHEEEKMNMSNIVTKYIVRPLNMLFTEPAVTCMAIYASFVFALIYMFLEVIPIVYLEGRHFSPVVSTLPYLGIFIGVLCAVFVNLANQPLYAKAMAKNNNKPVPEARLPPIVIGIVLLVVAFVGAGFNIVFQQCLNFLVDTYGMYAASALAANTFLRSLLACGLPLAARPMFSTMGVGPAVSLLGGIACAALPIPFIFYKYGARLRKASKFAALRD
ncbi:Major facilitator superfamily domain, general substrate transporter [Cordyceps fumosorosea ARSEF 2679]|uniref:Major facilitator superfamily domain, general substrate transporter n=1 Tax=Cordyceps fumosorosea (strain ARSEF 2679) TaxID=1081104 RepID=A0A167U9I9_CORFA|nr:Major facilitator superfamily domain, general substrate transporter [Cordyceps fumosorosea ARSEF 2679]OAA61356.1 Major facilitator superfamily domain, general substrate transporter [Cordyceps fumosorosea ARSEF 2679]